MLGEKEAVDTIPYNKPADKANILHK